jgi:peptide/nickel transport system substrate-binding protein
MAKDLEGYLKREVPAGRMSRRDFVQLAIAAGMSAAAADMMFTTAVRAAPKKGGSLKMAHGSGSTKDSLDPISYTDNFMQSVGWGDLSNSLTVVDFKGNVGPDLAESFEPSDALKKWVFKIRKGATFHNGKNVKPDDVIASFHHHMGKDSKSPVKSVLEAVTDIKGDGDNVIFMLSGGNADFPYIASDYHIPICPAKADGTMDWQSGVRTGPFVLDKLDLGTSAKLKRNPNSWGTCWVDDVEHLAIIDPAARTSALIGGSVHYMDRCEFKTVSQLRQNKKVTVDALTGYGHYDFAMRCNAAPFDKLEVRQAMKWAINRDEIVKKVLSGFGVAGNDNPIAPSIKYAYNPKPTYKYDPDKARSILKKAGITDLKVDLSTADTAFAGAVDAAVLYQQQAKKAGIDINVIHEPNDTYWDTVWLKKPFCADYWGGRPTIDWLCTVVYAKGAAWNETAWDNARFNELLVQARSETDEKKRAAMYQEMQQLIHDDGGFISIGFNQQVHAYSKTLAHGDVAANWEVDGLKLASRWWFA